MAKTNKENDIARGQTYPNPKHVKHKSLMRLRDIWAEVAPDMLS